MNNNNNENNEIREESKEGLEVARGPPYNSTVDSAASRGQDGNQLLVRSEDDRASPAENSSAEYDENSSSSMESNDTYGSVAALFSYEARKQGLAEAFKGGVHQESMPRFGFQGQLKQPMGNCKGYSLQL